MSERAARKNDIIRLSGSALRVGLELPSDLSEAQWRQMGVDLGRVHGGVSWWIGDWWAFGAERGYGDGETICEKAGLDYGTVRTYASVARAYELSIRIDNLSFAHHAVALAAPKASAKRGLKRVRPRGGQRTN